MSFFRALTYHIPVITFRRNECRARKSLPTAVIKKKSQKEVVATCLEQAIAKAGGNGEYRFSLGQLYYAVRPYVIKETGKEPDYTYFCRDLIGSCEAEHGDIPMMYRDERGTLYHPHCGQDIPIGTIAVENYHQPAWTFNNKVLYIKKEGFFHVLKEKKIPEKYDMALLTSKGYASRAVKDLLDVLGENSEEEITFFVFMMPTLMARRSMIPCKMKPEPGPAEK
jgi:DNA topoisomerase VI, subunit A